LMSSGTGELKEARQYGISRFEKTNLS